MIGTMTTDAWMIILWYKISIGGWRYDIYEADGYTRDSYYISYYNLVCQTFRVLYLSMIDAPVGRHLEFVLDSVYL